MFWPLPLKGYNLGGIYRDMQVEQIIIHLFIIDFAVCRVKWCIQSIVRNMNYVKHIQDV